MGSYYDYYSSYFPSYHRWAEQNAAEEEPEKRKKNVRERHSLWKLFTAAFLVVILILSITAAVVIPVVVLRHFNSYGGGQGGSGSQTPSVPLTGTNVVFITDVKIADSMGWSWNSQLLDSTTSLYQLRAGQVCQSISSIYNIFPIIGGTFVSCQVNAFRFGSIYVNLGLTINCQDTSSLGLLAMSREIQSIIVNAMATSFFPASVYFNTTSLNVNAVPLTASNPCQAMPCQQICQPGGSLSSSSPYVCSCFDGYQLVNGKTCIDINECNSSSNTCSSPSGMCVNLPGTYSCVCNKGYYDPNNSKTCVVIPFCGTSTATCDPVTTTCQNVIGNYTCTCKNGYSNLQANNSCLDINECQSNNGWCDTYTTACNNTIGSYGCECLPNFERIPGVWSACQNIDECFTGAAQCDANTTVCVDKFGNYSCDCKWGYQPNPNNTFSCTDVNECAIGTHNCDLLSTTCNNTIGGFDCLCLPGFLKNASRRFCTYQGMCPAKLDMCDHNTTICTDTGIIYNYTCNCKPGYTPVNQFSCKDIDECATGTFSCNKTVQHCVNTVGSFTCLCKYGITSGVCNVAEYGAQVYVPATPSVAVGSSISFTAELQAGWSGIAPTALTVPAGGVYLIIECVGIDSSATFPRLYEIGSGSYGIIGPTTPTAENSMTACESFLSALTGGTTISVANKGASPISLLPNVNSLTAVNLATIFPNGNGLFARAISVILTAGSPTSISFNAGVYFQPFSTQPTSFTTPISSFTNFANGLYVFTLSVSSSALPAFSLQLKISSSPQAYFYFNNPASDGQTSSRTVMLSLTTSDTITVMANPATSGTFEFITLSLFQYAPLPTVSNVAWLAVGCTSSSDVRATPNVVCSNVGVPSPNITISPANFSAPVAGIYWVEVTLTIQLTAGIPADVTATLIAANATSSTWATVAPALVFSQASSTTNTGTQTLSRSSLVELNVGDQLSLNVLSMTTLSTAIVSPQLHDSEFGGFLLYPK